jgi:hypothetical protein
MQEGGVMSSRPQFLALVASAALVISFQALGNEWGNFVGKVVTEWLNDGDGRKMKLLEPFSFVNAEGVRWEAPKGSIVDGASIPRFAWSIIGGPFEGKYREASVIHDVACIQKARPWQEVHRTFYEAMMANGVNKTLAKIMYGAVYHYGPRWERRAYARGAMNDAATARGELAGQVLRGDTVRTEIHVLTASCVGCSAVSTGVSVAAIYTPQESQLSKDDFKILEQRIARDDLSLIEIENFSPSN